MFLRVKFEVFGMVSRDVYYSPLFFKPEHRVYLKSISVECISLSQFENEEVETASQD